MIGTEVKSGVWVRKPDLWRVAFHARALRLISFMSGMVEVLDTVWVEEEQVLLMIVRVRDRSGFLFRRGDLTAEQINKFKPTVQPLLVSSSWSNDGQEEKE